MQMLIASEEEARLDALYALHILDTPPEYSYDKLVALCQLAFEMPMAAISLIDRDRQWLKSHRGFDSRELPRADAFCSLTINQDQPLIITDALADPRVENSTLVRDEPRVRFYVGAPLILSTGERVGALCLMDTRPRTLSDVQLQTLRRLAELIVRKLELRADISRIFWDVDHSLCKPAAAAADPAV